MAVRALLIVLALCVFVESWAEGSPSPPLIVKGRVFCDACAAGHFSKSSFYLAGAKVGVQCASRQARRHVTAYAEGTTGLHGEFSIPIGGDHEGEFCVALLLRSAHPTCNLLSEHGSFATVLLIRNAGLADGVINTGPFGFVPNRLSPHCAAEVAMEKASISEGE